MSGFRRLHAAAVVAGLSLSAALVAVAQVGGDQLNLLARGWLLAARGVLVPFGNPLSSGGNAPGALTSWLVGAPLELWMDHRAPVVLIWSLHLAAWWLLDRALAPALTPVERAAFAVLFVLNPWRLQSAAMLWNPNYLVPIAAAHLATARALADRARFAPTLLHTLALGLGAQLHPAVLLLGALSVLLWWRGYVRVSWGGFAAGVGLTVASLLPWLLALGRQPEIAAASEGFPFRGLVLVAPMLKGLLYWLRYPAMALDRKSTVFDFTERLGADVDRWLAPAAQGFLLVVSLAMVVLVLRANWLFFAGRRGRLFVRVEPGVTPRDWLAGYVGLAFVAAALVFAASPTTPQSWQAMPLFPAAVLAVALGAGRLAERFGDRRAFGLLAGIATCALLLGLALGLGSPNFRCTGRGALGFELRASSPMFEQLGLQERCPWRLEVPGTWWPDVLPPE
jgi:hypothetical protein